MKTARRHDRLGVIPRSGVAGSVVGSVAVPIPVAAAAAVPVFDAASKGTNCTLSVSNRRVTSTTTSWASAKCLTTYATGKRHAEFLITAVASAGVIGYPPIFGVATAAADMNNQLLAAPLFSVMQGTTTEAKYNHLNGGNWDFLPIATPAPKANDRYMIAIDFDAKKIWLGWKGTWFNGSDPAAGTGAFTYTGTPTWLLAASVYGLSAGELTSPTSTPSGFSAW